MELDELLNGQAPEESPVAEAEVQAAPEPEAEAAPSQPRDEAGRFAPKGDEQPAPEPAAAPPAAQENAIPPAALAEERRKRQEAEARAAQFERQIQQLQQPAQRPQEPAALPSIYEDENGFTQGLTQQAVQAARQQLLPEVQSAISGLRFELSRESMRAKHDDFDTLEAEFMELAKANPTIAVEADRQPNPVAWAYQYAKNAREVKQIGSLDVEAIKRAAIEEYRAANQAPAAPAIPTSLADTQSSRSSAGGQGPLTLNDILGR